jgi:hypothetical protein
MNTLKRWFAALLVILLIFGAVSLFSGGQSFTEPAQAAPDFSTPAGAAAGPLDPYTRPANNPSDEGGVVAALVHLFEAVITAFVWIGKLTVEGLNTLYEITPEFLRCFIGLGVLIILVLAGVGVSALRTIAGIRNRYL